MRSFLFQISSDIQSIEVLSLESVTNFNSIQSLDIATPLSNAGLTLSSYFIMFLFHFSHSNRHKPELPFPALTSQILAPPAISS